MPPRGSNSEVEVERIRKQEQSDFRQNRSGSGPVPHEKAGYGRKHNNSKNPKAPKE